MFNLKLEFLLFVNTAAQPINVRIRTVEPVGVELIFLSLPIFFLFSLPGGNAINQIRQDAKRSFSDCPLRIS